MQYASFFLHNFKIPLFKGHHYYLALPLSVCLISFSSEIYCNIPIVTSNSSSNLAHTCPSSSTRTTTSNDIIMDGNEAGYFSAAKM